MEPYIYRTGVRWADLDPNFHVLHSRYYDYGATCRMGFLVENGLTTAVLTEHNIGPILLKESCTFRKEIRFGDELTVTLKLSGMTANGSRWSMVHEILKGNGVLAAVIHVDGAWLDINTRRMAAAPAIVQSIFEAAPKSSDFQLLHK